jgi:hypothetical protein
VEVTIGRSLAVPLSRSNTTDAPSTAALLPRRRTSPTNAAQGRAKSGSSVVPSPRRVVAASVTSGMSYGGSGAGGCTRSDPATVPLAAAGPDTV